MELEQGFKQPEKKKEESKFNFFKAPAKSTNVSVINSVENSENEDE